MRPMLPRLVEVLLRNHQPSTWLMRERSHNTAHGHRVVLVHLPTVDHADALRADFVNQVEQLLSQSGVRRQHEVTAG